MVSFDGCKRFQMILSRDYSRVAAILPHHAWLIPPEDAAPYVRGLQDCGGSHEYWIEEHFDKLVEMGLDWVNFGHDMIKAGWAAITMMGNGISMGAKVITSKYFSIFHDLVMNLVLMGNEFRRILLVENEQKQWEIPTKEFLQMSGVADLRRTPSTLFNIP